jgi:hypothetical protein
MFRAKERAPTFSFFVVFTFGLTVESIKKLGGASLVIISAQHPPLPPPYLINLDMGFIIECHEVLSFSLCHIWLYNCIPIVLWRDVQVAFCFPLDKLMQDLYNVVAWHLFFLLPKWCLTLSLHSGEKKHRETWIWLKHFSTCNWEKI